MQQQQRSSRLARSDRIGSKDGTVDPRPHFLLFSVPDTFSAGYLPQDPGLQTRHHGHVHHDSCQSLPVPDGECQQAILHRPGDASLFLRGCCQLGLAAEGSFIRSPPRAFPPVLDLSWISKGSSRALLASGVVRGLHLETTELCSPPDVTF